MQTFWDTLRVITIVFSLATLGLCVATSVRPMQAPQRLRFLVLGGYAATTGVYDFVRLGETPILYWRLITDVVLGAVAAYAVWSFRHELTNVQVREPTMRWSDRSRTIDETRDLRLNTVVVIAYLAIGATLILQPSRYDNTPSYQLLLDILPQWAWGIIYLIVAVGLTVAVRIRYSRVIVVGVYTAAAALTGVWLAAFVVRYVTNSGTTIVNITSWGTFLTLIIISAITQVDRSDLVAAEKTDRDEAPSEAADTAEGQPATVQHDRQEHA